MFCREEYFLIRQQVIDTVLATDMSKHFDHLNRFIEWSGKVSLLIRVTCKLLETTVSTVSTKCAPQMLNFLIFEIFSYK